MLAIDKMLLRITTATLSGHNRNDIPAKVATVDVRCPVEWEHGSKPLHRVQLETRNQINIKKNGMRKMTMTGRHPLLHIGSLLSVVIGRLA